jgi:hypothetical protein
MVTANGTNRPKRTKYESTHRERRFSPLTPPRAAACSSIARVCLSVLCLCDRFIDLSDVVRVIAGSAGGVASGCKGFAQLSESARKAVDATAFAVVTKDKKTFELVARNVDEQLKFVRVLRGEFAP